MQTKMAVRTKVTFGSENQRGELGGSFCDGDASEKGSKKGLILIHEWWGKDMLLYLDLYRRIPKPQNGLIKK